MVLWPDYRRVLAHRPLHGYRKDEQMPFVPRETGIKAGLDENPCQNLPKDTVSVQIQMATNRAMVCQRQARQTIAA